MSRWPRRLATAVVVELLLGLSVLSARNAVTRPPADARTVAVTVVVLDDRSAAVTVIPGGPDRPRAEVAALTRDVAAVVVHGDRPPQPEVFRARGRLRGFARVRGAYLPGERAEVEVRLGAAGAALADRGWTRADVRVVVPEVERERFQWASRPGTIRRAEYRWHGVATDGGLPDGIVWLEPEPYDGYVAAVLSALGVAAVWAGISLWPRRRHRMRRICGGAGLVLLVASASVSGTPRADVAVAGEGSRAMLTVLGTVPPLASIAVLFALWLLLVPFPRVRRFRA